MKNADHPLISVIVPVWNPGPAVSRCIKSLQNQTLKEIELIIVDDCGNDNSMDVVRVAAAEDSRIHIMKNEYNMGAGFSRNRGIEAARGEYLSFVDSDDYVATDFLELLYAEARKKTMDIVKGSIIRIKGDGTIFSKEKELNQIIRDGINEGCSLYRFFTYEHQAAIYRKEYLLSNHIRYGVSKRAQDNAFLLKACSRASSISLIDEAHYFFCERRESAMHTAGATQLQGYLQAVSEQLKYVITSIPKDKDVLLFLQGLFLNALKEGWRYDCIYSMKEESGAFISGLQSELVGLPFCDDLSQKLFSLRALKNNGVCLPRMPYVSPWEGKNPPVRYAKLAKTWTDYYMSHSKERCDCRKDILQVYSRAFYAVTDRATAYYSAEEKKEGKIMLQEQLKRLPRPLRVRISLSSVKQMLRF